MDLNETKRKRVVPAWMRGANPTACESTPAKPKSPPARPESPPANCESTPARPKSTPAKTKSKRPNYPPIAINKHKRLPKLSGSTKPSQQARSARSSTSVAGPSFQASQEHPGHPGPGQLVEDYVMTVEELTQVAMEVVEEERLRRAEQRRFAEARKSRVTACEQNKP